MKAKAYLKLLLATYFIEETLNHLKEITQDEEELNDIFIAISGDYYRYLDEKRRNQLSRYDEKVLFSQIRARILKLINLIPDNVTFNQVKIPKYRLFFHLVLIKYWPILLFCIFTLGCLWYWYLSESAQKDVKIRAELSVNKLDFTIKENSEFVIDKEVDLLQIQGFKKLALPLEVLQIQGDNNDELIIKEGLINVDAVENRKSNIVILDNLLLQSLQLNKNTTVIFDIKSNNNNGIPNYGFLTKPGNISGKLAYIDSISFQLSNINISSLSNPLFSDNKRRLKAKAYINSANVAGQISFKGQDNIFSMTFLTQEDVDRFSIKKQNIAVDSIKFFRLKKRKVVSSIKSGKVFLLNANNEAFDSISIPDSYFFIPRDCNDCRIISMNIISDVIQVNLMGTPSIFEINADTEERIIRNPNSLSWQWHNKPFFLLAPILIMAGMSMLLIALVRKPRLGFSSKHLVID